MSMLRPFTTHGVDFSGRSGDERYGTCPFCGKPKKFYVNSKTQLWQCKVCSKQGNLAQFLHEMAKVYEENLTPTLLQRLAADRQLPAMAFASWHLGWDGVRYTIPVRNIKGEVVDIRLNRIGQSVISTAGCHVGLFGAEHLAAHPSAAAYLCEGEWDTIALDHLRRTIGADGVCVGVPGAGTFKPEWSEWFRNRVVHTHYDHDDAGAKGEQLAASRLTGVAKDITYVRWPKVKPDGYDLRDFVVGRPARLLRFVPPQRWWNKLHARYRPTSRLGAETVPRPSIPEHLSEFDRRLLKAPAPMQAFVILNERHFTVKVGNKMAVGEERPDKPLTLLPYEQFKNRYLWHQYFVEERWVDLGTLYLESPEHRHYDGQVVFRPEGSPRPANPDDYNQWKGFAVKPKKGDWSLFQAHLLDNVCTEYKNGVATVHRDWFEYFLNWMADFVQRPGRLPGVAIVLRGPEGVGKTAIFNWMAPMFPPQHSLLIANTRGLTGNFNAHLQGKVLVLADEAFFVGQRDIIGPLQSMVTSPRLAVEPKYIDIYEVENCIRLLIASNNEHVIQAAAKARRYFVLTVGDKRQKDFAYFNAITQQMNHGGTAAMLYDLQRRDISTFNPMAFPETSALNEQKELSLPPHAEWLKERLMDADAWQQDVDKKRFYGGYQDWMKERGMAGRYPLTLSQFTKYLQDVFGMGIHYRPHGGKRHYRFPHLAESRRAFERKQDVSIWDRVVVIRRPRKP